MALKAQLHNLCTSIHNDFCVLHKHKGDNMLYGSYFALLALVSLNASLYSILMALISILDQNTVQDPLRTLAILAATLDALVHGSPGARPGGWNGQITWPDRQSGRPEARVRVAVVRLAGAVCRWDGSTGRHAKPISAR